MEKILTIVVPSYNVERFLDQTLESFINESILNDIEVLIVDDGSKDRTAEIGQKYADKYPDTFYVISKENGGHGSTINCGIARAEGRYFKVVDGDDWVCTEGLSKLVELLKICNADYVFTNYYKVDDITGEKEKVYFSEIPVNQELPFKRIIKETQISMHALVIKTELLKETGICIDENSFYVDVEYILYPVPYVKSVIYYDIFVYMYRVAQEEQSVSIKGFQKHMQNHIDVTLHILDYISEYKDKKGAKRTKVRYMEKRVTDMVISQVGIFTSFSPFKKGIRRQFKEFDKAVKGKNHRVYVMSGKYSGMLRLLRIMGFHFYLPVIIVSRLRNWKVR